MSINSLSFPPDSEIRILEKSSLSFSSITHFTFPPNAEELQEGWCNGLSVKTVNVLPSCKNYTTFNNDFILRKSDTKSDIFDILVLSRIYIEEAIIPSFIKVIGPHAFNRCPFIKKIEFSQNSELETIEKFAFYESTIAYIKFPSRLRRIGEKSFKKCYSLRSIEFEPNSELEIIEEKAFKKSTIESFTIPTSNVKFGEGWCDYAPYLNSIEIYPNNTNYMKYNNNMILRKSDPKSDIFDFLVIAKRNIQHAIIPPFVKVIGPYTFNGCRNIQAVIFKGESQLQSIEKGAFSYSYVRKLKIPPHLTKIGVSAFYKCQKLSLLEFSENSQLEIIEKDAFKMTGIKKVSFPLHLKNIGDGAFEKCSKLNCIEFDENSELKEIGEKCFSYCDLIEEITIPVHITDIKNYSFQCKNLRKIVIPPNSELKRFGSCLFCISQIESISFPPGIEKINENWCIGMSKLKTVKIDPKCKNYKNYGEDLILSKNDPETDVFDVLFYASRSIDHVVIPSFIKKIGAFSFSECINLKSVEFPIDSKLESIEDYAFNNTKIKEFKVLPQIKYIGKFAFSYCENLKTIEIPFNSELEIIGDEAFSNTSIESIFIPEKIEIISMCLFHSCNNLQSVSFAPNSKLHKIEEQGFIDCGICNITLPSHLKEIGELAFFQCSKLTSLDFEENSELEIIEKMTFSLTSIDTTQRFLERQYSIFK